MPTSRTRSACCPRANALPDRALWRNQALVRDPERAPGLAEDASQTAMPAVSAAPCVRCSVTRDTGMVTKTHFPFRIDVWDDKGNSIMQQHVTGVDDFQTAVAT